MTLLRNPAAQKRWRRFRARRRAWYALWILLTLYLLSLGAELLCNDLPLYVRCGGRSFFPVWRYYPEDAFLHNGVRTRPNYKALRASPLFRDTPGNFMLFPPLDSGPFETLAPESLRREAAVLLVFQPRLRVGSVDIGPDLVVVRATAAGAFFAGAAAEPLGARLDAAWELPPAFREALAARWRNEAAPAFAATLRARAPGIAPATLSLAAFQPRAAPPRTVRVTFRDPDRRAPAAHTVRCSVEGAPLPPPPPFWETLPPAARAELSALARRAAAGETPPPAVLSVAGAAYEATARREEVRWPHPPVPGHWLGIDTAGRDVLARLLYGLRTSMTFGLILVAASMALGILIGAVQGYYAGKIDIVGQRLIEVWSALPFLYVMILMGSIYGRSFMLLLTCYGIFHWIGISYYVRAEFLRLRNQPFVEAARCLGIPGPAIMVRHILPNALNPVITLFPFSLVGAIVSLTALDYLGFGLPPPTPSWGELLQQAQQFRWAWWLIFYPSLMLFAVTLLGVFVGEGVRDAYDPHRFSRLE